ncbi:MAG: ABC transporter substrate-binding protein [Brevibacterium aurantiacum]|nr:ABC transporter substrate-binding protein [Brevibacterium aurantiacum]
MAMRDFIINSNPDKPKNRELLDPKVRKAMEQAINRQAIVDTAWVGEAEPGSTIIAPVSASNGQQWHNDKVKTVEYSIDQANRLLDEAGYKMGSGGVRVANGHQMKYEVIFADDESGPGDRAFEIIKADFDKIGIKLSQRKLDASATFDAIYCGDDCAYRDFDLAMWDWFPGQDPDFMLSSLTCEQYGDWNDSGYCNKEFDALREKQAETLDPVERKAIIDQMQQKIYDDRPYIILTYDVRIDAWSPQWEGFVESPQGFFNNWSTQTLESVHQK